MDILTSTVAGVLMGLGLLVRLEKSLHTEGPHWYVWSRTRLVSVWTLWGGPHAYSSKPWCFWRIFTLWQLWQKPTPTPSPGSWYLMHRDMFLTKKDRVEILFVCLVFQSSSSKPLQIYTLYCWRVLFVRRHSLLYYSVWPIQWANLSHHRV